MRTIFWSLLAIVFCFFVSFVGCDSGGDGDDSSGYEEALDSYTITVGSSDENDSIFRADGYLLFDISHSGDSRFRCDFVNRTTMQTVSFLTTGYGNFEGTVEDEVPEGDYFVTCDTSGSWTIDVYGNVLRYSDDGPDSGDDGGGIDSGDDSGGTDSGDDGGGTDSGDDGGGTDSGDDGGGTDSGDDGGETDSGDDTPAGCPSNITCPEISTCEEACYYLKVCGFERLDGDGNNIPCQELCDDPC